MPRLPATTGASSSLPSRIIVIPVHQTASLDMSTARDQHLEIINPSYCIGNDGVFPQFQKLPPELRLAVWKLSAKRHRLLEIEVPHLPDSEDSEGSPASCVDSSSSDETSSGSRYTIAVRGSQLYSKLFRVNRESRQAALEFYRVQLPCLLQTYPKDRWQSPVQMILYFNPEYDFVRPFQDHTNTRLLVDFIHSLKAHDPQHVGLVNMALDYNDVNGLLSLADTGDVHEQTILADTLSHLREVIWMLDSHAGRGILGPLQGYQGILDMDGVGVRFNHSMPVRPMTLAFDLLEQDPRAIGSELEFVATDAGRPRQIPIMWQELMDKCKIQKDKQPRARILFAYEVLSSEQHIVDGKTAKQFLRNEEDNWLGVQRKWYQTVIKHAGKVPVEGPQELSHATRPAIGFWLFPAEAFGGVDGGVGGVDGGVGGDVSGTRRVFDLRGHWPQLALSYLS